MIRPIAASLFLLAPAAAMAQDADAAVLAAGDSAAVVEPAAPATDAATTATAAPAALLAPAPGWRGQADIGASVFFGNTEQTLISTRTSAAHASDAVEIAGEASFTYGEVSTEEKDVEVSRRSWLVKLAAAFRPMEHLSPFATGSIESSLEKRIDLRYALGAGANVNVMDRDGSQVDVSIAALGERTVASPAAAADTTAAATSLLRGSARLRVEHALDARVRLTSETTYEPALRAFDRFTVKTLTSLGYQMHRLLALTVSLRDSYDSEARTRGARANNEGELVLGLQTKF